ncbi:hypothetical protein [Bradyrhizobium sp. BWC-3-1]|uniref:hypothetical protein n=1 Tax=Bradyrhizobium sp. BWC-3-1 TaxID=3080012 RepID=UPI00293F002C|nr:hypothetical protein [Bradyrhizobium sp. BWC-3-1]WOH57840.1 hypothetical protein RX329_37895 [Bradyrhizobium sp. BWC-3-1]
MTIARTVRPIHFKDIGGSEFERLVFAYHLCDGWTDLAWFGQTGSDQGRDIIGARPFDDQPGERTVIQCVNRGSLTQAKAEKDMTAAVNAATGKPDAFKLYAAAVSRPSVATRFARQPRNWAGDLVRRGVRGASAASSRISPTAPSRGRSIS